nr:hypothetical protein [Myxococcota bacterium]
AAPRAHLGPALRLAVDVGPLELVVLGRLGAPEELAHDVVSVIVTRYTARAGAAIELVDDGEWRALIGATIGVLAHHRSTDVRDPSIEPTSASTGVSFVASAEARAQWMPPLFSGALGVELAVGADVLATAPRFVLERAGDAQVLHAPWPVQPTVALGLVIRAP